ncbi:hypothetical protein [Bdellovibrio sp. HCB-162]|uniref:hypothetical protein n=1 Tax=Bdellovibrio sp. HCB-162 TaxID=3394234 RepID=UPI0039BD901B
MNNLIGIIVISLLLFSGCSFSKNPHLEVSKNETKPALSEKQKNLIAATKLGDINLVKSIAASLSPSEHKFFDTEETPMSIAIETNQPEVVRLFHDLNINPGNLGRINETLNQKILNVSVKKIYEKINILEAEKIKDQFTASEEAYYDTQSSMLFKELEQYLSGHKNEALANLKKLDLNCLFVANQAVVWMQAKDANSNFKEMIPLLQGLSCSSSSENLDQIYKLELVRQFQNNYNQTTLLEFIFKHPNFGNPMWNIDNSGIWISPSLLLNVVYSDENRPNSKGHHCSEGMMCSDEISNAYQSKIEKLSLAGNKYDLILTKDGKILNSFLKFSATHINDNDEFYVTVALYMYGKRHYTSPDQESGDKPEVIPWSIWLQIAEEGVHD